MESQERWDRPDRRDLPAIPGCLACQEGKVTGDSAVSQENAENRARQENWERPDQLVPWEHPALRVHVDLPVSVDLTVQMVPTDFAAWMVSLDSPGPQDQWVRPDLPAFQAKLDSRARRARRAPKEGLVPRVLAERTACRE